MHRRRTSLLILLSLSPLLLAARRSATPSPLPSPAGPILPVGQVNVPPADCSPTVDSTPALEGFLAQVQNGSEVIFPAGGRCLVNLTLDLGIRPPGQNARTDTVFDLNGATIFRTSEPSCTPNRDCNGPIVSLDVATNVTIRNGSLVGGGPPEGLPTYDPASEHDTGLRLHGDTNVTVQGLTIEHIAGDCIDMDVDRTSGGPLPDTSMTIEATTGHPFVCSGAGRQGISANEVDGLIMRGLTVELIAHSGIDLEPRKNGFLRHITVTGNRLGETGFAAISIHGSSMETSDVTLSDNVQTAPSPFFISAGNQSQRGPLTVTGNQMVTTSWIVHFSGRATGNTLSGMTDGCMFQIDGSGRFEVSGNTAPTGVRPECVVVPGKPASAEVGLLIVAGVAALGLALAGVGLVARRRRRGP